jgi:magnesium-transporting ATPase (P-type)
MPVNQSRLRHRDNQLLKMLFIYVTSSIICTAPFTIVYFIAINFQGDLSSKASSMINMFIMLANINYATSFYIYTLGTPFYRDELYKLCKSVRGRFYRNQNAAIDLQPRRITQGRTECGGSGV